VPANVSLTCIKHYNVIYFVVCRYRRVFHFSAAGIISLFTVRQMQENFRVKGKKLYFGFVDLEKAFDRVPREVIQWAMRAMHKLGVEEWLVSAVVSMYTGAKTVVRTVYGNISFF